MFRMKQRRMKSGIRTLKRGFLKSLDESVCVDLTACYYTTLECEQTRAANTV